MLNLSGFIVQNESVTDGLLDNIQFEIPDLLVQYNYALGKRVNMEAFKLKDNDLILKSTTENRKKATQLLMWFSLGHPKLIKTSVGQTGQSRLFHFNDQGMYTYVETLTQRHQSAFTTAVSRKHSIAVNADQIIDIPLSTFECKITLNDTTTGTLTGRVSNFDQHPFRLDFQVPLNSIERQLVVNKTQSNDDNLDVALTCLASSRRKSQQTFLITPSHMKEFNMSEKLFGESNLIYVTRSQLKLLASEIYQSMNVSKDFQPNSGEDSFRAMFVNEIIASFGDFKYVNFDQALESLSMYEIKTLPSLKGDLVKSEYAKILKLQDQVVTVNKDISPGDGLFTILGVVSSIKFVTRNEKKWKSLNKSIEDQLIELNRENRDDIKWHFDNESVLPKSIKVVKLTKAFLEKQLNLAELKKTTFVDKFTRTFTIYTNNYQLEQAPPQKQTVKNSNVSSSYEDASNLSKKVDCKF